jgi:hypothetical protein
VAKHKFSGSNYGAGFVAKGIFVHGGLHPVRVLHLQAAVTPRHSLDELHPLPDAGERGEDGERRYMGLLCDADRAEGGSTNSLGHRFRLSRHAATVRTGASGQ